MKSLFLNTLYIFEYKNRLAKRVDFQKGINVITSDRTNGNDVGKSVLLKSIYHTLGADSIFDSKWSAFEKTYLLNISVSGNIYFVYRSGELFRIYNEELSKIFSTTNRKELSEYLGGIFEFHVKLPNRHEDALEITPPVYSYLLNYVDQDHMNGTKFASFKNLGQYADYKENVIYNHFGIFNDEYFNILKKIEELKKEEKKLKDEKLIIESMLIRIKEYLEGMDAPTDLELLKIELERKKEEYSDIVLKLKKVKNSIVKLRNDKFDLERNINDLSAKYTEDSKIFSKIHSKCPVCAQEIDELDVRIRSSNKLEDYFILKDELDSLMIEINRKLNVKEEEYRNLLKLLESYEKSLNINESVVSSSIKHMGYMETQENMIQEMGRLMIKLESNNKEFKDYNRKLKEYNDQKKKANSLYEEYMTESKIRFGLEEIGYEKIKNITQNYEARGSNRAISTIIWYFNLLKIKHTLNENTIRFPLVLDSPNNVESDDTKEKALFEFIFTNIHKDTQLILSTLGFNLNDYKDVKIDNIISLDNDKYHVLNSDDYEKNEHLLKMIFEDN
ncbi:PH1570 family protein [Paenibacillus ehimensis]|uniref:PH1570 family protein n=1 Tax=Paenibacillus ehimensis TaxID=79264 RepID=A0ABT8VGR4_9BACL|nr:PH1570 family protein [Paenibacillus ehimensis]MDO3680174.1 PH1570 family protein [Paenibacillus ehimensis]